MQGGGCGQWSFHCQARERRRRDQQQAAGPGVHGDDVLFAAEDLEHGIGLLVVLAEPDGERLLGVVLAPDQLAAAGVAPPVAGRAVVDQAVVHPAARAQPPGESLGD